jgi:aminopeptidase N
MTNTSPRFLADYSLPVFTINTVNLSISLEDNNSVVFSELEVERKLQKNEDLVLNGEHLKLVSVVLDNRTLHTSEYLLTDTLLTIPSSSLPKNKIFSLQITTETNPAENTALEGLFKSGDAFCTQCEAEGFRRISYYLDRPDVMAMFTTKVIADKKLYPQLLSNGNKVDSGDLPNGKHFVTWHDPYPKPCYLFALVAGDFDILEDSYITSSGRNVALEIFVDKGNLGKAQHAMVSLQKSMKWDEDVFGLEYDLDIYMIVAVDFFNMGAMENKGLNVFNSKFVLADNTCATDSDYFNIEAVIGHEYFHNWTGNRVTCRDWFQLSLKEGLTVFRDQQFSADMHSSAVTRIKNVRVLRSQQFAEDAGPMAHPIRPEKVLEMNNFYTLTVYEKGAEVIRMLHTLLGESNFRKGMDLYFSRFDGMAVTCDDFINAMADASQRDLNQFKRWYSQLGTPKVSVKDVYNANTKTYKLSLSQQLLITPSQAEPKALHIPMKIELVFEGDNVNESHLLELTELTQEWVFKNIESKPVLALLADFSAPVKLDYLQSDNELLSLITQAENSFCRWDAGQKLLMSYIQKLTLDKQFSLPTDILDAFKGILNSDSDAAFIAEQLVLPSFDEAVGLIAEVDPIALLNSIKALTHFLASGLQKELLACYQKCLNYPGATDTVANRSLKNICLAYLTTLEQYQYLAIEQYQQASGNIDALQENMTDTLAALDSTAKNNLIEFERQMTDFEEKWQSTTLVMDKWFALSAGRVNENIFEQLEALLQHDLFTLKNPNRARSLIGAFAMNNPRYFHCKTGRGYEFLSKQIILLNDLNPQVASRLITPLIQFKNFEPSHQALMKASLLNIQGLPKLSNDLKEKLDAALC